MRYLEVLLASRLPMPPWTAIGAWALLYAANCMLARRLFRLAARHGWWATENRDRVRRRIEPSWMFVQVVYAAAVFAFGLYAGGALFALLGGGMVVTVICVLGMNVQALLASRVVQRDAPPQERMKMSAATADLQVAARLAGAALLCALLGMLLAHLAPLGGAAFCAATAAGYWRRARRNDGAADAPT